MPITRGTKQATLFGGGERIRYLLQATFDAADQGFADAQVLDTADEGVQDGQLTVVEVDGTLAISSNKMAFTAQTTPLWGDLGIYGGRIIDGTLVRTLGRGIVCIVSVASVVDQFAVGWKADIGVNLAVTGGDRWIILIAVSTFRIGWDAVGALNLGIAAVNDTDYVWAIILGGYDVNGVPWRFGEIAEDYLYGAAYYVKGGIFAEWTLLWRIDQTNTSVLYASVGILSTAGTLNDFRVPDQDLSDVLQPTALSTFDAPNGTSLNAITPEVGEVWTEQSGVWDIQSNRANPDGAAIATVDASIADLIVDCVVNGGTADNPAIVKRFSDTSNYWYLQADRANNQLELHEYNATIDTVRANAAVTINNSTDYDLRAIAYGQTIDGFIDAANKISYGSAALNETATIHGIRAENTVGQFDNFVIFPRTATIYDTLDAV